MSLTDLRHNDASSPTLTSKERAVISFLIGIVVLAALIQGIANREVPLVSVAILSLILGVVNVAVLIGLGMLLGVWGLLAGALLLIPISMIGIHAFFSVDLPRAAIISVVWIVIMTVINAVLNAMFAIPSRA